jgi:serine/threonine protein kinase
MEIARYKITRKIGEGGYGEVHEAYDRQTGQFVAIKRFKSHEN